MKSSVLTVTLNPAVDKTVRVPGFRTGRDFREDAMYLSAGGKGLNVSRVLKRLGIKNIASGFLGGPSGDFIKSELRREGIRHDFCPIKGNTRTSLTIMSPPSNTITRVLERGPRVTSKELGRMKRQFISLINKCRYVILSGRNIPGVPDSFYGELIALAKKEKKDTVFDTSGAPYEYGIRKKPFMIKPNLKEAEQSIGQHLGTISKIKEAAKCFQKRGVGIVAISMGSRGAVVFNGKEMIEAYPPAVKRKSPVGCGDAFIGGFIASHMHGKNFVECVKLAVACGTANALGINPGYIDIKVVNSIFNRIIITR